jgi:hypothetical protein
MRGNNASADPILWGTIGITAVVLLIVLKISSSIGADFKTTLAAFTPSILIILGSGLAIFKLPLPKLPISAIALSIIWPLWWPVIDSIAHKNSTDDQFYLNLGNEAWWSTSTFKWIAEIILIVLFVASVVRERNK